MALSVEKTSSGREYKIKDLSQADFGRLEIELAEVEMPAPPPPATAGRRAPPSRGGALPGGRDRRKATRARDLPPPLCFLLPFFSPDLRTSKAHRRPFFAFVASVEKAAAGARDLRAAEAAREQLHSGPYALACLHVARLRAGGDRPAALKALDMGLIMGRGATCSAPTSSPRWHVSPLSRAAAERARWPSTRRTRGGGKGAGALGLAGPFPSAAVFNLSVLASLSLVAGRVTGALAPAVATLRFSGRLPAAFAPGLRTVDLSKNAFSGRVPPPLLELRELRTLVLPQRALRRDPRSVRAPLVHLDLRGNLSLAGNRISGQVGDVLRRRRGRARREGGRGEGSAARQDLEEGEVAVKFGGGGGGPGLCRTVYRPPLQTRFREKTGTVAVQEAFQASVANSLISVIFSPILVTVSTRFRAFFFKHA